MAKLHQSSAQPVIFQDVEEKFCKQHVVIDIVESNGFEISDDGKHYKLIYIGDPRYAIALAKTLSANLSGDNIIGTISSTPIFN